MKIIIKGRPQNDMIKTMDNFRKSVYSFAFRVTPIRLPYDIDIDIEGVKIKKKAGEIEENKPYILVRFNRDEFIFEAVPVISDKFVIIGKLIMRKCPNCPLTDEEIVIHLVSVLLKPILPYIEITETNIVQT